MPRRMRWLRIIRRRSAAGRLQRFVLKICVRDDPRGPDPAGWEARILLLVAGGPIPVPRLAVGRQWAPPVRSCSGF